MTSLIYTRSAGPIPAKAGYHWTNRTLSKRSSHCFLNERIVLVISAFIYHLAVYRLKGWHDFIVAENMFRLRDQFGNIRCCSHRFRSFDPRFVGDSHPFDRRNKKKPITFLPQAGGPILKSVLQSLDHILQTIAASHTNQGASERILSCCRQVFSLPSTLPQLFDTTVLPLHSSFLHCGGANEEVRL